MKSKIFTTFALNFAALMRVLFCLLIFLCVGLDAYCQKITGKVIDSASAQAIEYATVVAFQAGNSKPSAGVTTNARGIFVLDSLPRATYRVEISFIGYKTRVFENLDFAAGNNHIDLGTILLKPTGNTLKEVTITGQPPLVENKVDKLVYNATRDITSQGGMATDVLKNVPMVSVDVDGNVELQGSSNIQFLINGKPSTLFGNSVADALQSIPASQIQSIEVITNPGVKYDAQGTGGIINIILKRDTRQGVNGNVSLTTGTIAQNGSVNIYARKKKFALNIFLDGNARLTTTTPTSFQRTSTDTATKTSSFLQQNGTGSFNRHGFQSGVGFDWTLSEKDDLSGGLNYSYFGNGSNASINQTEQLPVGATAGLMNLLSVNNTRSAFSQHSFDPNVDYKHNFKNKEQQLEVVMDGSFGHNLTTAANDQYAEPQDSLSYGTRNNNPANENEYEIRADYVQPLAKNVNLGAGGKFSGYDISSTANAMVWSPYANNYLYNSFLSNDLTYHQKVYAAYTELDFPVGKLLDARLGGRYERTQVHSFYANSGQEVDKGYNTFIPSIFLMKAIGESQVIKLSYTIRINRPDYHDLNPFINTSDPQNIVTGNPGLKPEVWDRYEASYSRDMGSTGSWMFTLFYRQSNGDIQPFIIYYPSIQVGDTTYTNATLTTRENIGTEKNMGLNLFFDLHFGKKFEARSNIIWFYRHTINQVDTGYNSSSTIYRLTANTSYQLTNNFAAEFFGSFNSRHHEAQGYYPSFTSYSLALRRLFWNKNGSLALMANNFFSKYVNQRTDLYGPGFVSSGLRSVPYRSVGLNFTWKFGKQESKKEDQEDNVPDLNAPQQ